MAEEEFLLSLFCYPQAPLKAMLEVWAAGTRPVTAITFEGTPGAQALRAFGTGEGRRQGALAGKILPFLPQDDYDRVLWACDWNFVRGEDSFVRAQLSARPLVWHTYPQAGNAHAIKLQAFLDRYRGFGKLPLGLEALWQSWNALAPAAGLAAAWGQCLESQKDLQIIAVQWPVHLEILGDLAANLAQFCAERV